MIAATSWWHRGKQLMVRSPKKEVHERKPGKLTPFNGSGSVYGSVLCLQHHELAGLHDVVECYLLMERKINVYIGTVVYHYE